MSILRSKINVVHLQKVKPDRQFVQFCFISLISLIILPAFTTLPATFSCLAKFNGPRWQSYLSPINKKASYGKTTP